MANTYIEEARELPIYADCDLLVVGAGSAGSAAAVAAARAGCKNIILMERYGYMGGDVTGGYVIMMPNLSWYNKLYIRGIQEEWFTRLSKIPGAVTAPTEDEIGSTDPAKVHRWRSFIDCVSRGTFEGCKESQLVRAPYFEPNELKIILDEMVYELRDRITVMYHTMGARPIVEDNVIKGVIFESKEGRKLIRAKFVIDATGDGDIFSQAGAPYSGLSELGTRSIGTALVWRAGGVNWSKWYEWQQAHPELIPEIRKSITEIQGFSGLFVPSNNPNIVWFNNNHNPMDCTKIEDQTRTEIETRLSIHKVLDYLKEVCPYVWADSYLYDIAPQLGTRCSKRLKGEYVMTANDFAFAKKHDDVIAWHSTICQINDCGPVEIPYRAILAQKVENLLAPGRHLSTDNVAIDWLNLIPQCTGTGQAAGVAAAVAIADGTGAHTVDIRKVQDILAGEQNVPLPRNIHTDPSYTELAEEKQYGLYTAAAKLAKETGDALAHRQDGQRERKAELEAQQAQH
ncbi:MAG: FAD-dependent oxidoreductase [Oscillospiraceae bacterium]|nr:FAD-dependent oxidoreductase [Oscillospiraceae bacterium]